MFKEWFNKFMMMFYATVKYSKLEAICQMCVLIFIFYFAIDFIDINLKYTDFLILDQNFIFIASQFLIISIIEILLTILACCDIFLFIYFKLSESKFDATSSEIIVYNKTNTKLLVNFQIGCAILVCAIFLNIIMFNYYNQVINLINKQNIPISIEKTIINSNKLCNFVQNIFSNLKYKHNDKIYYIVELNSFVTESFLINYRIEKYGNELLESDFVENNNDSISKNIIDSINVKK